MSARCRDCWRLWNGTTVWIWQSPYDGTWGADHHSRYDDSIGPIDNHLPTRAAAERAARRYLRVNGLAVVRRVGA